jgi:hypothetical protein
LAKLWIWYNCPELQGGAREIRKVYFEHFPVPQANEEQTATLILFATERTQLTTDLQTLISKFQRTIQRKFFQNPSTDGFTRRLNPQQQAQLSNKLQDWYLLSYSDFISELGKKKVKLSLSDEAEWEAYFLQESKKALELKTLIETTDKEIDKMVYELYGLTKDEINIIES